MSADEYQTVTHFVYAPSKQASEKIAADLKRHGFAVEVREADGSQWAVTAVHSLPTSVDIDSVEEMISALASDAGATYDGYERGRSLGRMPAPLDRPD